MKPPRFRRRDVMEAHYAIEVHYHEGGWLHERPSNVRRREATHVQLFRMGFKPRQSSRDVYDDLTFNGRAIYHELEKRYGFVPAQS